jgi:hypothetical protein
MKTKLLLAILMIPSISYAFDDYDVDFEPSKEPGISIVRVTVDGCTSKFKVKDKDFKLFSKSDAALDQILDLAIDRATKGCQ